MGLELCHFISPAQPSLSKKQDPHKGEGELTEVVALWLESLVTPWGGVHMLGDLRGLEVPSVREKGSQEGSVRKATFMLSVMNQT